MKMTREEYERNINMVNEITKKQLENAKTDDEKARFMAVHNDMIKMYTNMYNG